MIDLPLAPLRGGFARELRPSQAQGVEFLAEYERVLLADQMGTGKTTQAIGAIWETDAFPALVVAPASLRANWRRELETCLPGLDVCVVEPGKGPPVPASVTVVSYDMLPSVVGAFRRVKAVVFDESHYLKESGVIWTKAARHVAARAKYVWPMSGTPVVNRPSELIPVLEIMRCLDELGGWSYYTDRYCAAERVQCPACRGRGWRLVRPKEKARMKCRSCRGAATLLDYSGASHLDELSAALRERRYLRRLKSEVLKDIPPKAPMTLVPVELEPASVADYDAADEDVVAWLESTGDVDGAARAKKAKQVTRTSILRRIGAVGRYQSAFAWARRLVDSDDGKVILFAHHRELQEALARSFEGEGVWLRGADQKGAERAVSRFQSDPQVRVMVASLQAGGLGHSMTAAKHVVLCEYPMTPKDVDQAEDRAHRIGQTKVVQPWHMIVKGTIDEDMAALIAEKRAIVDQLEHDGNDIAAQILSNQSVV